MFEKLEELAKNNKKISDFHIRSGSPLAYRQTGEIFKIKEVIVKVQDLNDLISTNCNEVETKRFQETHELDSSVTLAGLRFRANFYKTIHGPAAVLRRVESVIPEMGQFDLPQVLYDIIDMHKGLVLVTGPTGSGKSTTLAAIVNEINKTRTANIITVEDPVEFIHKDLKSIVSHREVGKQTKSFGSALRAALREDPDVILVGEMRDLETVSGDYFDVVNVNKNEYFFTLADVSGKGIKAGMYMAKASSIFRTLSNLSYPLEKVVFGVNNELVEAKFKGMFVTAVFGKFNIETGEVSFVNAGHESIMVFDRNKNFEFMKSEMPPIGIIKYFTESMVKSKTINLKEKTFVVYTDGVTEGYLKNGQELGAEGVQKIVTKLDNITPKNIVDSIAKELNWGAEKLRDDITCLALDIKNTELIKVKKKKEILNEK